LVTLSIARIGIVPASAPAAGPVHGFWLYDDEVATVEILSAELIIRASRAVDLYRRAFENLTSQAVYGDQARALIGAATRG